jgi:hypothetical protein
MMKLAEEAVKNPGLLKPDLIEWLLSPSSQRSGAFFFFLGRSDEGLTFHKDIEALGQRPDGAGAFSAYWSGWAKRDRDTAERHLDELACSNAVTGDAIVQATAWLGAGQAAIDRVRVQIQIGRVDPEYVARMLMVGQFMKSLTEVQFEQLLKAIAGETFKHAAATVIMLDMWIYFGRSLRLDFGHFE